MASLVSILTGQTIQAKSGETSNILGLKNISVLPIMLLISGIVLGAYFGLLSKNFDITNQGKLFGNTVSYKGDPAIDSLIVKIKLLTLRQEVLILEKQNEYLLHQRIVPTSEILSFNDFTNLKKELGEQNNTIDIFTKKNIDTKINSPEKEVKSVTVLHATTMEDLCKISYICRLTGADLVAACKNIADYDIKSIVKSPIINTDSLKFKINQICNCK